MYNTGKYKLHIEDKEWTKVDQKGYKYKPFKNHADCINSSSTANSNKLNGLRGCDTTSDDLESSYYDLNIKTHPYKFDIDSINSRSNPNSGANYLYVNNLAQTKNQIKNGNLSYHF